MAPYLRRSKMTAWKKASEKISNLYYCRLVHESYSFSEMSLYVLSKFAFRPFGGSLVILMLDWSTGTGNDVLGIEVNQSL